MALVLGAASGCGLLCNRYCDRERERCEHYNHGCCAPAQAPPAACPPGCSPAPGAYYGAQPPVNCP
jgi:hypothetical protein